jgi:hypothetical protein
VHFPPKVEDEPERKDDTEDDSDDDGETKRHFDTEDAVHRPDPVAKVRLPYRASAAGLEA